MNTKLSKDLISKSINNYLINEIALIMRSCLFLTRLGVITKWKDNPISKMKGLDFALGMILRDYAFFLDVLQNKV
jgi:hypothetical protein